MGRAVPSCQLLYKPAVTPGSGGRRRRRGTGTPASRLRDLLSPPGPFARPRTRGEAGVPARLIPKAPGPRRRGTGCWLLAVFPRAPLGCRRARRQTEPGGPARGLPGRPARCALNREEDVDRDARPGGGSGSLGQRLTKRHRGARAAYLGLQAPGPGEIGGATPTARRAPARRGAACPSDLAHPCHGPRAESGSSSVSGRRASMLSPASGWTTAPDRTLTNLWPRLQGTCGPGMEQGDSRAPNTGRKGDLEETTDTHAARAVSACAEPTANATVISLLQLDVMPTCLGGMRRWVQNGIFSLSPFLHLLPSLSLSLLSPVSLDKDVDVCGCKVMLSAPHIIILKCI